MIEDFPLVPVTAIKLLGFCLNIFAADSESNFLGLLLCKYKIFLTNP